MAQTSGISRAEAIKQDSLNWAILSRTRPADRTSVSRTRRLLATPALNERRTAAIRHPDENFQYRKLLTDPGNSVPLITRPRNGCTWGAMGEALQQHDSKPLERQNPVLMNEGWDCLEMDAAFPEFCAVGGRALPPNMKTRLALEVRSEPTALPHIVQVGLARIGGEALREDADLAMSSNARRAARLDKTTSLLESFVYTSCGDLQCSHGHLEIVAPGSQPGLGFRRENWCSGAPAWLCNGSQRQRILMEVDLCRGRITISLGDWSPDPLVLEMSSLLSEGNKQWVPFVSLTAVGQSVRILDFHTCVQI